MSVYFCPSGKRSYVGKADAKRALKTARGQGKQLYTYRCPSCNRWHLATKKA